MEEYMEVELLDSLFKDELFEVENDLSEEERELLAKQLAFNEYVVNGDYENAIEIMRDL